MSDRLARASIWALCTVFLILASPAEAQGLPDRGVDLHAHMFMEHGLGWLYRGGFDEPLQADDWSDRLSSKANAATLATSGLGVVVVALFAHPVYVADVREGVRRQIRAAKRFVRDNPEWAIAKSPAEARRILHSGRRALVLSLEGAGGVLESEEDLREFVDREGIRIVTALHLVDDRYGGAAQLDGYQVLANPRGIVDQLLDAHHDHDGLNHNDKGLSPLGRRLALELIRRGVWIDLTHASDRAADELADLAEAAGQPLLVTHAQLRSHRPTERATSTALLQRVGKSQGVIGLLPSEDGFAETERGICPPGCAPEACRKSVHAFAAAFREAAELVGAEGVLLGTDFNGGMRHLSAACHTGTALDEAPGLFHQGQLPLLWQATAALGVDVPPDRARLQRFLEAWDRVEPHELDVEGAPPLPQRAPRGPSIGGGLGFAFATGDTEGAAILPQAMLRLRKDHATDVEVEPMFYLLHARGELAKTFDDDAIPYAQAVVAPFGVELVDGDNRLRGEGPQLLYRRHLVLDQRERLRAAAFSGLAQSMVGLWKAPPHHDLFLALKLDLLGYEGIRHQSDRPDLHGIFLANGGVGFGGSVAPKAGWLVRVRADAEADITLLVDAPGDGVGYQTDLLVGGGIEVGTRDRRFTQLIQMRWYATRESTDQAVDRSTPHVRAGVQLGF